ncbi:MAG: DUF418 domain-containing protein, partial [bacterium]
WLFIIVMGIWSLELWWSPRWLANHNFGPVEWVWRGLAYRKFPPFRKETNLIDRITAPKVETGYLQLMEPQNH